MSTLCRCRVAFICFVRDFNILDQSLDISKSFLVYRDVATSAIISIGILAWPHPRVMEARARSLHHGQVLPCCKTNETFSKDDTKEYKFAFSGNASPVHLLPVFVSCFVNF